MSTRIQWSVAAAAAALCASVAFAKPAAATRDSQPVSSPPVEQLHEVIVEAMKIKARVIDLPVSITTFDAKQLKNLNIVNLDKLAYYTPGLEIQPTTRRRRVRVWSPPIRSPLRPGSARLRPRPTASAT